MKFGWVHLLNFLRLMNSYLSILKNAGENSITYYVGNKFEHISHLKNCTLICSQQFDGLENVKQIIVEDPQLYFYKLSLDYKEDYLDNDNLEFNLHYKAYIHKDTQIGNNVKIGAGSIISKCIIEDNVEIHSNVVIYAKSHIKSGSIIESNTTIGGTGVMWVWDQGERVYLEQLGNVLIEENTRIGSQVEIVRGSANETTLIGKGTCIAHGTLIGHGCQIGEYTHMANGIKLGGNAEVSSYNFLGSGAIVSAGVKLLSKDIILGAGTVATKDIIKSGVYVGTPAEFLKPSTGKLSGMPTWRN